MTSVFAQADGQLGALALYLTFAWLASAIVAAYLSNRKGYGERPGLASGLLLNAIGVVVFAAEIGSVALWLTYGWLASAIISAYLSNRKGYGERPGLASGLLLNAIGILVWLVWPAKDESMWKTHGPFGTKRKGESDQRPLPTTREDPAPPAADDQQP